MHLGTGVGTSTTGTYEHGYEGDDEADEDATNNRPYQVTCLHVHMSL